MATTAPAPGLGRPAGPFKPLDDDARSKVRAQMEFYFSDSNLPRDKFLRETVEADPEGFVDISLLATFSRMRALLAPFGGPHNDETVAALVDLLGTSAELTVSDDGRRVRRTAAVRAREEIDAEVEARSVYASPFAMTATIDEITAFFAQHATVRSVRLRRHVTSKDFKGSVFVELADAAACEKLVSAETALEHDGARLSVMMKKAYLEKKKKDRVEKAAANAAAEEAAEKAKAASQEKEPTIATGADPAANADTPDGPSDKPAFTPGLLLRFSLGADVAEGVRREDLSEALAGFDAPKFIDFKMGDTGGCLRFEDAETVANIVAKHGPGEAAAPLEVGGSPVAFAEMRGDEEAAYWRALAARSGQGGGRGGRGGRGRGGGRGGGRGRGGRGKRGNDGGGGGGKRARN